LKSWCVKVGLGILRQYSTIQYEVGVFFFFPRPHASFDPNFCFWLALNFLQSDPISEDEFMTKWDTVVGDTFISNTSLKLLIVYMYSLPLFGFGALYDGRTSNRPCHAVHGPLSQSRTLEGRTHRAVSVGHRGRHESRRQALTGVCESPDGQIWLMVCGTNLMSWKRDIKVPLFSYSSSILQYLAITICLCAVSCERDSSGSRACYK